MDDVAVPGGQPRAPSVHSRVADVAAGQRAGLALGPPRRVEQTDVRPRRQHGVGGQRVDETGDAATGGRPLAHKEHTGSDPFGGHAITSPRTKRRVAPVPTRVASMSATNMLVSGPSRTRGSSYGGVVGWTRPTRVVSACA